MLDILQSVGKKARARVGCSSSARPPPMLNESSDDARRGASPGVVFGVFTSHTTRQEKFTKKQYKNIAKGPRASDLRAQNWSQISLQFGSLIPTYTLGGWGGWAR